VVRVSAPPENEFGAPLLSREKATGGTQNTANMTAYRDGVGPSPWGGVEPAWPPLNAPLGKMLQNQGRRLSVGSAME